MKTISKLSDECRKCSYLDNCDNNRMVVCAMEEWKPNMADVVAPTITPLSQPMLRIEHPITINMGEYGTMNTSLEEISEKIKKDFYKNLNCSFNR